MMKKVEFYKLCKCTDDGKIKKFSQRGYYAQEGSELLAIHKENEGLFTITDIQTGMVFDKVVARTYKSALAKLALRLGRLDEIHRKRQTDEYKKAVQRFDDAEIAE